MDAKGHLLLLSFQAAALSAIAREKVCTCPAAGAFRHSAGRGRLAPHEMCARHLLLACIGAPGEKCAKDWTVRGHGQTRFFSRPKIYGLQEPGFVLRFISLKRDTRKKKDIKVSEY
jgi:hypothetical protein